MTRFSALIPFLPARAEQLVPVAALVQGSALHRLWSGQLLGLEAHQLFAHTAGLGLRVPVGTCVSLMPLRNPMEAVVQARSLARITGHSFVAGIGPGATGFQRAVLGSAYRSPLTAVREYLTACRALLDGAETEADAEYFPLAARLTELPHPPVELGAGVLRPRMARLAGRLADVALTWLTPPEYLRDTILPALTEGAAAAGRPVPELTAVVHVALRRPGRDPVELATRVSSGHLTAPHYTDMLRRAGIPVDPADPAAGARALVDAGVFLSGDLAQVVTGLAAYRAAGVREIVLNLSGVGLAEGAAVAVRELAEITAAVTA
ncbi:LLM class flavin-dependent oxidoreductase [Crossiella sp. SN42]|uniref:LLM class flavin-dependent oxidoreductase n=1 Tax=Crossiella sp. SN42 TaxID=2944808 RepID=UPI00207C609D|nr:LLM class flavin-dependent oxidoreductase [Crossiella sp. SN42]MCO1580503.1 LLM class flavin-dependent oxidoreductase [Crossiella sp. SN42]